MINGIMQKVKVSACGEHLYADPVRTPLLFVLLHPPSAALVRRMRTIALHNGYNGHAVTWLCSARVASRRALTMRKPGTLLTATGQDKLWSAVHSADVVVAAWGELPSGMSTPNFGKQMLCMGRLLTGNGPITPTRGAKFKEFLQ